MKIKFGISYNVKGQTPMAKQLFEHLQLEADVNAAARAAVDAIETESDDLEFLDSLCEELNP